MWRKCGLVAENALKECFQSAAVCFTTLSLLQANPDLSLKEENLYIYLYSTEHDRRELTSKDTRPEVEAKKVEDTKYQKWTDGLGKEKPSVLTGGGAASSVCSSVLDCLECLGGGIDYPDDEQGKGYQKVGG